MNWIFDMLRKLVEEKVAVGGLLTIFSREQLYFQAQFEKSLAAISLHIIFAVLSNDAALVKGLRRLPFTEESRVRIPYVVLKSLQYEGFFFCSNSPSSSS